ncbi:tetratricopeptide repeat protein [Crocosphaera sp. XPORK-15E]|uniref:tetratricopeptide repeat protein n=1 Tax=Crocosphaera sp. XPORK-15E TaxID=3110247 RepID=UPI002B1EAC6F|nr:tetratricopeptide repeat protein [Crocosphaera sp. XPORK-15E]MEA5533639.1 tetratricopeptide repeat protein [Crocosphaera sp. XPORK-15E]
MNETLPIIYLSGIVIFLGGLGIFILFQIIKTRRIENRFYKLQKKLQNEKGTAQEYYELGSLYLDKKLYVQAVSLLQKGFKIGEKIEPENKALMHNALGFAYFSQEQLDVAIRHYKDAIKLYPDYVIALNNLANAYERKQMIPQAIETYEESLKYESDNKTAKNRIESLRKRLVKS